MFRGISVINIDPKGRCGVPTKYRQKIIDSSNGCMVVTIDSDEPCLLLYPLWRWEEVEQKIQDLPSFSPAARRIQRLLIGHATEVDMDSQGRVLLPAPLREHAGMDKQCVFIGQGHKFELWGQEQWEKQRSLWIQEGVMHSKDVDNIGGLSL